MHARFSSLTAAALVLFSGISVSLARAGDLNPPPGAPAPTMKTLQQVEPRGPLANDPAGIAPLVIDTPGTYYLTEDILALTGSHGIEITTSNVTLDLRGFAVIGNRGLMTLSGIRIADGVANVSISNGTVRDHPEHGIEAYAAIGIRVENIGAIGNGKHGIRLGTSGVVHRCHASENGALAASNTSNAGIRVDDGGTVSNCTAMANHGYGISVSGSTVSASAASQTRQLPGQPFNQPDGTGIYASRSSVTGCTSTDNEAYGFYGSYTTFAASTAHSNDSSGFFADESVATDCTASFNAGSGFSCIYDTTFDRCNAKNNSAGGFGVNYGGIVRNCNASTNGEEGIWVGYNALIIGNNVRDNIGTGIYAPADSSRIEGNMVTSSSIGFNVTGTNNLVIGNSARGNTTNYSIVAGNEQGQIIVNPGMNFINTNENANFAY